MRYLISSLKALALMALLVLAGFGVYSLTSTAPETKTQTAPQKEGQIWTCSMHPQVRKTAPGNCPICGMPLIPTGDAQNAVSGVDDDSAGMLTLSEHARAMASVETVPVEMRELTKEVRAVGKIQYNEAGLATIVTRVDGYVERLFVDYTGIDVKKGDHLAEVYSQELYVALQEMLIWRNYDSQYVSKTQNVESSRVKLRQFGVTDAEIDEVLKSGKVRSRVTFHSPINGTVVEKMIFDGSHVNRGDMLYRVANLESVWVMLDIYEYELSWIQYGRMVEITAEAYPGQTFKGIVTFISPSLNPETRTVKVRVNLPNSERLFKPEMFVHATVRVPLTATGKPAPTGLEGQYTCPMHPEVIRSEPGKCPICGMELEKLPGAPTTSPDSIQVLAVPKSAVLDSGRRTLVYVERERGKFVPVAVVLGPRTADYFPVISGISGLKIGDRVAVRGNFLLDSQFQIKGMPSLFYEKGQAPAGGHQHGAMPGTPGSMDAADQQKDPHAAHSQATQNAPAEQKH